MRRLRSLPGAIAAVALAVLLAWALWPSAERPEYVTAAAERGPIVSTVTATGTVNPVQSVLVGTYVSGPIQAIDVDFNSPVRRGQRIAKIDPRTFIGRVDSARASLRDAEAHLAKAQADLRLKRAQLQRQETLARGRVLSADELDVSRAAREQAEAEVALAEAEVDKARAALREAEVNLGYTDIVSPVDGIVVSRNVDVGQTVAASFQTPTLFVIADDLERMQVNAYVSEADIGRVREGERATFTVDAHPGRAFPATVRQVRNAPTTLQNVVTYDVVLDVDNRERLLKPGMTANVRIVTAEAADALLVPSAALRFRPPELGVEGGSGAGARGAAGADAGSGAGAGAGAATASVAAARAMREGTSQPRQPTVYRLERGRPVAVAVTTGLSDEQMTQVESPDLRPGDAVILRVKSSPPAPSVALPGMGPRPR